MEPDILSNLAELGIGATFAVIIFYVYRTDRKESDERRSRDAERYQADLRGLIDRQIERERVILDLIEQNIKAITALEGTIRQAGLVDKLADLEARMRQPKG